MKLLRTTDRPDQKYTLAFVGYGDEREHAVLELTYNYGVERYEMGNGLRPYRHRGARRRTRPASGSGRRAATSRARRARSRAAARSSRSSTDPDGYKIELIQSRALTLGRAG